MIIGVWTFDRTLAEKTIDGLEEALGTITSRRRSRLDIYVQDDQGNVIKWVRPTENARGYKFDKAYVDIRVNMDSLHTIILPCLPHGSFKDLIWIADERITVYDYLHAILQPLFEVIVLILTGHLPTEDNQKQFHAWMEQPYSKVFPAGDLSELKSNSTVLLDYMTILLGKTEKLLPPDKQTKLRDAMKGYCEVCDYIKQQLAEQQKT